MAALGPARLFRRQLLADRGAALTVVIVVLVVAALLAAWPRAIDAMFAEEVREQVTQTSPRIRDVSGQVPVFPPWLGEDSAEITEEQLYGRFEQTLLDIRDDAPPLVRAVLGEPYYQLVGGDQEVLEHIPGTYNLGVRLTILADRHYEDRIRLVAGELPSSVVRAGDADPEALRADLAERMEAAGIIGDVDLDDVDLRPVVVDIALSETTADRLGWPLGQQRRLALDLGVFGPPLVARLTGIFAAADPDSGYWVHGAGLLQPLEEIDPDRGVRAWARGFVAPTAIVEGVVGGHGFTAHVCYPLDGSALTTADGPVLVDELRAFTTRSHAVVLGEEPTPGVSNSLLLSSGTITTLDDTLARQASATALLGLVAAWPVGVALAVLALGSKLVIDRRRRAMALVTARGASHRQVLVLLAIEGALLGLPAAALAVVAAARLVPGAPGVAGLLLPIVVGLAPGVLLPVIGRPGAVRTQRSDPGRRRLGWLRSVLEALTISAAAVAVILLNRRGLTAGEPGRGVDPLLVATPLLVAVAVGVLVLRFYPLPVAAAGTLLKRRRGLVGYIGTARAVRDPAAGLAPVLALVVGLSVAVFSTVLWSTTQAGGTSASVNEVGADIRASGAIVAPEQVAAAEELPGVIAAVAVADQGRAEVTVGNRRAHADVFVTDTVKLAAVQSGLTGVAPIADGLDQADAGVLPVMLSADLGAAGESGHLDLFSGVDIAVAAAPDQVAGLSNSRPWILVDRHALDSLGPSLQRPARALLIGTAGAPIDEALVAQVVDPQAQIHTATDVLAEVRAGAVGTGLMGSFVVAVAVVGVLSAVAVLLTMVIAAPSRGRLFSQLRTLGLSGRQAQGLATWEIAPLALVALAFGTGLGIGIPWLVFSAIDLRPLTGTSIQPPVAIDWTLVAAAAAAFVVIVAIAVTIAVAASRRLRLGTVLRVGEEL